MEKSHHNSITNRITTFLNQTEQKQNMDQALVVRKKKKFLLHIQNQQLIHVPMCFVCVQTREDTQKMSQRNFYK